MDDIEQQCDDAVFEVCDARERYPAMCADEREKSTILENEISMEPVKSRIPAKLDRVLITNEQKILFDSLGIGKKKMSTELGGGKLKNLLNKMEDLKIAAELIRREKYCDINRLLKTTIPTKSHS